MTRTATHARAALALSVLLGLVLLTAIAADHASLRTTHTSSGHKQAGLREMFGGSTSSSSSDSDGHSSGEQGNNDMSESEDEGESTDSSDGEGESTGSSETDGEDSDGAGADSTSDGEMDGSTGDDVETDVDDEKEEDDVVEPVVLVTMSVGLAISKDQFDATAEAGFKTSVAQVAGTDASDVVITSVSEARRRLLAGVNIDFTVQVPEAQEDSAVASLTEENLGNALSESPVPALNTASSQLSVVQPPTGPAHQALVEQQAQAALLNGEPDDDKEDEDEDDSDNSGSDSSSSDDEGLSEGETIGVVVGSLVGAVCLIAGACFAIRGCTPAASSGNPTVPTAAPVSVSNDLGKGFAVQTPEDYGLCYPTNTHLAAIGAHPPSQPQMMKVVDSAV
mmetsp:Transcript_24940/g.59275  ORF Transcript_24940/g.59275 Transcript_24940/m.59275 type:complete len:394 (+) Transcript_24940:26-1207(+)